MAHQKNHDLPCCTQRISSRYQPERYQKSSPSRQSQPQIFPKFGAHENLVREVLVDLILVVEREINDLFALALESRRDQGDNVQASESGQCGGQVSAQANKTSKRVCESMGSALRARLVDKDKTERGQEGTHRRSVPSLLRSRTQTCRSARVTICSSHSMFKMTCRAIVGSSLEMK